MLPLQFLYTILSFFTFANRRPSLLDLSNEQQEKFDELLSNYKTAFREQIVGFKKETTRLTTLLCFLAAQGSGGLVVVAGDKVQVKTKMISTAKKIWIDIHKSTQLKHKIIFVDQYTKSDLSVFSNRLLKTGILHLKNVDPNSTFLQPVFEKLNTFVDNNKLLCIIELVHEDIKVKRSLCGIPVPDWLCLTKPDTEQIEDEIQERWVITARQNILNTRLSDQELLKAVASVAIDCTLDKLQDVLLFLTEMRQNQEPAEKKRRVDSNGNSYVASRTVSADSIAEDFLQEIPTEYKPFRSRKFSIPEECKK